MACYLNISKHYINNRLGYYFLIKEASNNLVIDFFLLHHRLCDEIIAVKLGGVVVHNCDPSTGEAETVL